jgi:hypothetical protein
MAVSGKNPCHIPGWSARRNWESAVRAKRRPADSTKILRAAMARSARESESGCELVTAARATNWAFQSRQSSARGSCAPRRPPTLSAHADPCCSICPSSPMSSNGMKRSTSPYREHKIGDDQDNDETDQGSCTSSGGGSGSPRMLKRLLLLLLSRL